MNNEIAVEKSKKEPSYGEFVALISLIMSLTALTIDVMLPSLPQIGSDLGVKSVNDRQLVVSVLFLGLAVGQLFFGPLSDKTGRKPAIYAGYAIFIAGALISVFALNFPIMLLGRLLQGIGISSPRAVSLALVRDRYAGREMARVMSFVMTVFILVPMLAPSLGQAVLLISGWRSIFLILILIALITFAWFALRMPETLVPEKRTPFKLRKIFQAIVEILKNRISLGYTITAGLISGVFLGYLNSTQQIFQEQYALGRLFPLYFGAISLALGLASLTNARIVVRLGMRFLVKWSLFFIFGLSLIGLSIALLTAGKPSLWMFIAYLMMTFFCIGILFGNLNSLAMEPLGHLAGVGSAVVGSLSTLISMILGTMIGRSYDGTVLPLVASIAIFGGLSILVMRWTESGQESLISA
ncbi:MAG: multidrug effflux MFS transporter [Anaerolineales bacterium]|jgi:DHA1 family bicyclomycin/chloramphenicol resistance-like MFS transporter